MKYALPILIFILLVSFSSAIKISPVQSVIYMNQYETNCTNVWVLPEANYSIKSKWGIDGMGDLSKYNKTKENIKLDIKYTYISDGKYEICFTPSMAGNLSGIIYFYDKDNMVEIGSWVDLKVDGINPIERISILTGNAIKENKNVVTNVGLGLVFFVLVIVLALVIRKSFK